MDNELTALGIIFTEFYYWLTVVIMFLIHVDYPTAEEEGLIARLTTGDRVVSPRTVITGEEIRAFQKVVRRIPVPDHVYDCIVRMVRASRPSCDEAPDWIRNWVSWGAGPRASQHMILSAKAFAVMEGESTVSKRHIDIAAMYVLRHRVS